jgi:hypothetical protein
MNNKKQPVQAVCKPAKKPVQDRALRSPIGRPTGTVRGPARTADILPKNSAPQGRTI